MKILNLICTLVIYMITSYSYSQIIRGSVKFQSERTIYTWTFVKTNGLKTQCDSLGKFELKNVQETDTLEIFPIPIFIKVKIYNYTKNFDTLQFDSIPLFNNIGSGIPVINFKSKRASRKYFKKLEKERELEKQQLIQQIENYTYNWYGKAYKLYVVKSGESLTVLIDLGKF